MGSHVALHNSLQIFIDRTHKTSICDQLVQRSSIVRHEFILAVLRWKCNSNSIFNIVVVRVFINNIQVFGVAMNMKKWVHVSLLSSYRLFRTAVNDNKN
jgi:hypothetical protein